MMYMQETEVRYEAESGFGAGGSGRDRPVRSGGHLSHLSHQAGPGHAARLSGGLL